jgi:hypothetical protein
MKYISMHLGAWYLGSTIQLKELYSALGFQRSDSIEKKELSAWLKKIKVDNVEYITHSINSVRAVFQDKFTCDVTEDGVILMSGLCSDLKADHQKLNGFMNTKFIPFWHKLFSLSHGGRADIFDDSKVKHPIVLVIDEASTDDMTEIFQLFDELVFKKIKLEVGEVWIGDAIVIVNGMDISEDDMQETVRYLMFARVYEMHVRELFMKQRDLWEEIESIRHQRIDRSESLPPVRDHALMIQDQAYLLKSRSRQMQQFLTWRENYIMTNLPDHILTKTFQTFFISLRSTQEYLHELWEMTVNYADATVRSISLMYSQIQQRELSTLQKIFLVSAVASVVSLGTVAGSNMITYDKDGSLLSYAEIVSWDIQTLIVYGLVVFMVSVVIYYLFYLVFSKFHRTVRLESKISKKEG